MLVGDLEGYVGLRRNEGASGDDGAVQIVLLPPEILGKHTQHGMEAIGCRHAGIDAHAWTDPDLLGWQHVLLEL